MNLESGTKCQGTNLYNRQPFLLLNTVAELPRILLRSWSPWLGRVVEVMVTSAATH
jgi:hypothetical protein